MLKRCVFPKVAGGFSDSHIDCINFLSSYINVEDVTSCFKILGEMSVLALSFFKLFITDRISFRSGVCSCISVSSPCSVFMTSGGFAICVGVELLSASY